MADERQWKGQRQVKVKAVERTVEMAVERAVGRLRTAVKMQQQHNTGRAANDRKGSERRGKTQRAGSACVGPELDEGGLERGRLRHHARRRQSLADGRQRRARKGTGLKWKLQRKRKEGIGLRPNGSGSA